MTCSKCNSGITPGVRFCSSCGTPVTTPAAEQHHQPVSYTTPPEQNNYYSQQNNTIPPPQPHTPPQTYATPPAYTPPPVYTPPPAHSPQQAYTPPPAYAPQYAPYAVAPRKGISPLIFVAIAAVVIAIAAAVVFLLPNFLNQAPLIPVQRAMANFNEEVAGRIESSPFHAFTLMNEMFQHGAVTLSFDFNYRTGDIWSPDVSGNFIVASDSRTLERFVAGEVRVMGIPIDINAVMNRERLAVQSNVIDRDNFYGITFATFARDMTQFGRMIGMPEWEINEIIEIVRMVEATMDFEAAMADDWGDVYTEILTAFFMDLEFTSENRDIRVGGQNISANRVEFVITRNDIMDLLHGLVDAFERDPTMRSLFADSPMMMEMPNFNEIMRELRNGLREFERSFDGNIRISLYIGRGDRLMQARIDADMRFEGERATFGVFLDLGSSANDTWEVTMDWRDDFGQDSFTFRWDFHQSGQNYVNSIRFFDGRDNITLDSAWNPNNGRFDLSLSDGWTSERFGGSFITIGGGFRLELDRIDLGWNETLDLSMTMSPEAHIPNVDFINIDRWDFALLDLIERSILGMLW